LALALVVAGGAATVYLLDAAPTSSGAVAEPAEPPPAEVDRGAMIPPSRVLRGSWGLVHRVRFAGEGEQVLTASQDGSVREWDADRAEIVHTFGAHAGPGGAIAISRDDTWLAAASGKKVAIYDLESHELRQTLEGPRARVFDVTFDPAGGRVAAASEDGSVTVWSLESGAALHRLEGKGGRAYCALFTPDGQTLLSAGHDGVIHVWNATTGAPERRLEGHRGPVNRLALSADGKTLVSASDDRTARIWHLPTGQQMHRLDAHVDEVWAVAFSPDEKRIATGGKGDILWQWDVFSGQLVDKRPAMLKGVMDVAYSPDGRRLAAGGVTGVAHLWLTEHALWHPEMPPEDYRRPPPEPIAAATELERLVAEANRALDAQDGGDLQAAQRLINQAASLDPEATAVKVVKARHEYKSGYLSHHDVEPGHLRRAHALLDEALAKDPGSAVAHVTMGWVLRFEKNWGEAKKHAAEARRLDPTDFRSRNLALQLAAEQGQDEAVIEEAKAIFAETKDPDMLEAACDALSDVYRRHRDWAGVDQMYRAQLIYAPESAWLRGNYAQYLVSRHDYPRGIEMAKEALAIRSYPAARRTLARAQAGQASRLAAKHTADGLREARALIAEARSAWRMPDAWVAFFEGLVLIHGADVENDLAAVKAAEAKFQEALRLDPKMTAAKKRIDSSPSVATRIAARK
ncbi:MAG: hypothetical protein KC731_24515, partial [Myxococcales bacterium]|nr:hypothetical protein [Myxococcales bacterium]